jgi:hypothetical protein
MPRIRSPVPREQGPDHFETAIIRRGLEFQNVRDQLIDVNVLKRFDDHTSPEGPPLRREEPMRRLKAIITVRATNPFLFECIEIGRGMTRRLMVGPIAPQGSRLGRTGTSLTAWL